jgi:hypothetical protein
MKLVPVWRVQEAGPGFHILDEICDVDTRGFFYVKLIDRFCFSEFEVVQLD